MEINVDKFRRSVQHLLSLLPTRNKQLNDFLGLSNISEKDVEQLLEYLGVKLLDPDYTENIAVAFLDSLLLIVSSTFPCDEDGHNESLEYELYQRKCVAIAKLMRFSVDVKRYAIKFFQARPEPFEPIGDIPQKKAKTEESPSTGQIIDSFAIVKCCYQLLHSEPTFFKELWNWSTFVKTNLKNPFTNVLHQLYYNHVISIITNMTPTQLNKLNEFIPAEALLAFDREQSYIPQLKIFQQPSQEKETLLTLNFSSRVVTNIEGVQLPVYNNENRIFYAKTDGSYDSIVRVNSTKVNLRSIALGISSSKAVCLSGPVGCGKTTLVEYLARKTGRIFPRQVEVDNHQESFEKNTLPAENQPKEKFSNGKKRKSSCSQPIIDTKLSSKINNNGFLRIQLGDQTDSKMLLGQYRCTDVPGEFIWLPGVLTQAVMNGYWLLLEDLDLATKDTFTVLSNLLENNFLSVPGFRDCVKIETGFQLFVTIRTNKSGNCSQKSLYSLLEKYLYTINILPLSRNELCKIVSMNYPKLGTIANRIVDVYLTFSSGDHSSADNLRNLEFDEKADTTENYTALPFEQVLLSETVSNSGRLVSTRDLVKLCERSNPMFSVTSSECAYFVFQNAVDVFCSYMPHCKEKTRLITSIGAKLGIIQSRCEFFAIEYKPEVLVDNEHIKVGRAELLSKSIVHDQDDEHHDCNDPQKIIKKLKLSENSEKCMTPSVRINPSSTTFSFTRMASCILERIAVCVAQNEPILLVGETGVGKTSSVQYLAERTQHKLVVINMNNQSDVSDLVGGFKPVDLNYVIDPLRCEFEMLFRKTFNVSKNEMFLNKFCMCYNQGNFSVLIKLMITVINSVFQKADNQMIKGIDDLARWKKLHVKLLKLNSQLSKSINISFAFIPGSLVSCIQNGDWVLLDEINLASTETLECLSTILEPNGSVVLLEKGDFTPIKRHPAFRIFACMNPNTDIGKKDLSVGIRNRFTEFFVDELTTDRDLSLLVSDYLKNTGIDKKRVAKIVKLYTELKQLSKLELNDGLGNRPVFSLRTLCRSLRICAKNLCGSVERNLYESFCMSFLTQLDPVSHNIVLELIKGSMLSNVKAVLSQGIPKPGDDYLNFEGYWIQSGPKDFLECANYILTDSVRKNLKDLARIISIGKLPILLQGPTSAGKTSLIEYIAKKSGNHCLRINNHEHTDLQEYIGTYTSDISGKLTFKEGVLVQAMRNGFWIILDELNLASTDILEALNRVLDDNRELFIPETQTVVKAHSNFMLFATQNPPGLYGGRKTLSRAFKNRFIELHFSEIPRNELEIILEKRCLIPTSYSRKMVQCMWDLQKNRKTTSRNVFTLRDLFRWGNRYTFADKKLLADSKYDWNQHLIEEGYLVLSAKVRTDIEIEIIEETLYSNFRKRVNLNQLFELSEFHVSPVTHDIIASIRAFTKRSDIVWTHNMTRMAVLTAKALQFDEPVLLVGPTGCGKTTVCQILASIHNVNLRILNCHMHTEAADFLGGLRPCRSSNKNDDGTTKNNLFEWADGPLIISMQEGNYFMADEISLAEDSVLERLNCILEPERTVLLAEKGGIVSSDSTEIVNEFVIKASEGFQFLATMNPGGDFGKKELSLALRNRFTEIWCKPSDMREDLIRIASNCMTANIKETHTSPGRIVKIAEFLVEIVFFISEKVEKFKFSVRDILAWANYLAANAHLQFPEASIFGLETIFLDSLEMLPYESLQKIESIKHQIILFGISKAKIILDLDFTLDYIKQQRGDVIKMDDGLFGIKPFFIHAIPATAEAATSKNFFFDAPTTKKNLFRLLSALSLNKPVLLEGPPGVGKTSIVESIARAIGYKIVRINLCEHTDLSDLFGTDLPAEDSPAIKQCDEQMSFAEAVGSFVWRDGPLLAALKGENTWILLDELNLAPQSVLEGLNAILDHRGEVYIPELNKTFVLSKQTRIFACQNPLRQGGSRKGLPQSFLNRFNKVYLRKLTTQDLLFVVNGKYAKSFEKIRIYFAEYFKHITSGCSQNEEKNLFEIYHQRNCDNAAQLPLPVADAAAVLIEFDLAERLVGFSEKLDKGITDMEFGYKGGPFEINLRDILRWCDLLVNPETGFIINCKNLKGGIEDFQNFYAAFKMFLLTLYERMKLVYYQRMRSDQDKTFIRSAFAEVFICNADELNVISEDISLYWTDSKIYLNDIVLCRDSVDATDSKNNRAIPALLPTKNKSYPLILSSQRELIKNLIECVHMDKPVLLCGPTDTGKTKLIDILCTVSNQICNSDNIDDSVTGSFQQIDLNRHLEEISQSVEAIFSTYIRSMILKGSDADRLGNLLSTWSDYLCLTRSKPDVTSLTAMSDELIVFRRRIQLLNVVIEKLLDEVFEMGKSELEQQQRTLLFLQNLVQNRDSLNTGGSFEWIDSKIVKSLKNGQYICLEHVNLCSSAVLDRLNSVFEPNGNLLLSEKGVTAANDEAEIVEKHTNFRAFLTIDPKNGELSRAMRNRCVEIALSKDYYNDDDLRTIVFDNGIYNVNAINTIIRIHNRIKTATEINNFNISHLAQFSFLVGSYMRIGYTDEKSIYVSGMEAYVYSSNVDLLGYGLAFYQNKLREIVLEESRNILQNSVRESHCFENIILSCGQLDALSLIKLQTVPLKMLLKDNFAELVHLFSEFAALDVTNIAKENLLKYFVYMLYECCSLKDYELRYLFLKEVLVESDSLQQLSQLLFQKIKQFENKFEPTLNALPWNTKLYPRIRDYATLSSTTSKLEFSLSSLLLCQLLVHRVSAEPITKLSHINALAYSQAVASQSIHDKINNPFLTNLSILIIKLQDTLHASLEYAEIDLKSYVDVIRSFMWINRMTETARKQLFVDQELSTDLIDKLVLHFKWLDKNLLKHLEKLHPNYLQLNPEFEYSFHKITSYILSKSHPLNLMRKIYGKQMTQFPAFYSEQQILRYSLKNKLENALSVVPVYGSFTSELILRKLFAQKSDAAKKCRQTLFCENRQIYDFHCTTKLGEDNENIPQDLRDKIQRFIQHTIDTGNKKHDDEIIHFDDLTNDLDTIVAVVECTENEKVNYPAQLEIEMLSLREYYTTKCLTALLTKNSVRNNELNNCYFENIPSLSCNTQELIKLLQSNEFKLFEEIWEAVTRYIASLETSTEFEHLLRFLGSNFRSFSTYSRLISRSAQMSQLYNLSNRSNVCIANKGEEISSSLLYNGPPLTDAIFKLICECDGSFKSIPLKDLNLWRHSLDNMQQLLWNNSSVMSGNFDTIKSNWKWSLITAKKLIFEVEYVQKICQNIENENFTDYNQNFQSLINALKMQCISAHVDIDSDTNHSTLKIQKTIFSTAMMNALIGSIELCLLTFTPLIDPVEKNCLKNNYIIEDINCISTIKTVYDVMKIIMKYKNFGDKLYGAFQEKLAVLTEKQRKFSQKVALRPKTCLYSSLVQDIIHFLKTNCEPQTLLALIREVQESWKLSADLKKCSLDNTVLQKIAETLGKLELWIGNSQRFTNHILRKYTEYYQDFIQPIECSTGMVRFGFEGLKIALTQLCGAIGNNNSCGLYVNINKSGNFAEVMTNIVEFPSAYNLDFFNEQSSDNISKNRATIFTILDNMKESEFDYFRLLKAKIVELQNRVVISSDISEEIFRDFDFALNVCNQIWQEEEERRRQKKIEDESLYVNKTKCETEDEELIEIQEIEENFPTNVQEDFGEFIAEDTLEKVLKLSGDKKDNLTKNSRLIRDEDYAFLSKFFITIMEQYTRVYYRNPTLTKENQIELNFIEPFKDRIMVFVNIFSQFKTGLNEWIDEKIYNSFSFAVGLLQEMVSFDGKKSRVYNFYKDSNIPEIISCTEVLDKIEIRVNEQLALYPEHASLIDISRVIQRVRTLPSTSPVVRFNSGFQILRQKVAQWNEVAHKNNHLRDEEIEIANYVQKWTTLELKFWRNCLSQTFEKVESNAYKYWFFIYNLLKEYINDHEVDYSLTDMKYTEKRFAKEETLDKLLTKENSAKVDVTDIIRILRQFVESACYGDFHIRISLLNSFEMYLHHISRLSEPSSQHNIKELIAGLRNLQVYFSQFTSEINETKKGMRTPIEKKLKEFVKIESYNKDLSYFSMRNNVARVHRNLNKFLREYQKQLTQKITPVFQLKDGNIAREYSFEMRKVGDQLYKDANKKLIADDVKMFIAPQKLRQQFAEPIKTSDFTDSSLLLSKVGKLFATSRNVVKETVTNALYPNLIIALDQLLLNQIETCDYLRNLQVDRSKERPKQVIQAKHILQQKRKSLSDLFKILTNLGLNYKTGLMELSLGTIFEDYSVPPFCVRTMLGPFKLKEHIEKICHLNENLDNYYAKCVFKLKLLQNTMLTPMSELGPQNIDRIKGFAVDTFLLVQNQRKLLSNSTHDIYDLCGIIKRIKKLAEINSENTNTTTELSHLEFSPLHDEFVVLKKSICKIRFVFEQFILLLECIPETNSMENHIFINTRNVLLRSGEKFSAISEACTKVLTSARTTLDSMTENNIEFLSVETVSKLRRRHQDLVKQINSILQYFKLTDSPRTEYLPAAKPLIDLLSFVVEVTEIKFFPAASIESNLENVDVELENVVHSILIAMQKLFKKYPRPVANVTDKVSTSNEENEEETEDQIHENHLKQKLFGELITDWDILNLPNVLAKMKNILLTLKLSKATAQKGSFIHKVTTVLPILEQYNLIADYYLFQQLSSHKVSAKLLSVMLTVFIDISSKGFCIPADLLQDEEGESKQDSKNGEGFGLEDGTGEKDASDKIESEDQLDDAKRPEDRKDDDNKNDDCKEEKGIEMSEDFEGKMQDIEKPEDQEDDSADSEDEDDLNKEMGETEEGAEKLDDQIWGDDENPEQEEDDDKEMNEEDGKGSKDEKDSHNDLESDNNSKKGQDEHDKDGLDATSEPSADKEKKQQEKDIDDMKDQEMDDDQVNSYHNELEEPPEPEELDLGDCNMDENDQQDNEDQQQQDDNPLDIDKMRDNMQTAEDENELQDQLEDDNDKNKDENDDSSDSDMDTEESKAEKEDDNVEDNVSEGEEEKSKENDEESDTNSKGEIQEPQIDEEVAEKEKPENQPDETKKDEDYNPSKDKVSKEDNVQSIPETENKGSADQVQNPENKDIQQEQKMDEQDTGEDKNGVGQAENDTTDGGHQGLAETKETISHEDSKNDRRTEEKRKQGRTNEDRTLGEAEKNKLKQLKTIDKLKEHNDDGQDKDNDDTNEEESKEYQHVKEPKNSDKTTLDNATEEQSKKIQHLEEEKKEDATDETCEELMDVDDNATNQDEDPEELVQMSAEKLGQKSEKPSKPEEVTDNCADIVEDMSIDGEVVKTMSVARNDDTTAHCIKEILLDTTSNALQELTVAETLEFRKFYQNQLTKNKSSAPPHKNYEIWQTISNRMLQNARELCEQLRLILEPTKCTRLKGDYRTGRRINMKKIIPYIASQFRKDKIWLRRTKPAQRDYKITIAIDDSKSMHHNNSKTLTLEAISLVSQALTLLESGRLSIVSFGESPQIILNHTEQFDGPKLVNSLNFSQDKTKIAELLDFIRIANTEEGSMGSNNGLFENLLLILSDGQNIFSEGKSKVKNAIKLARLQRMFLVYIIIDNPENKSSILDVQTMEILPDKKLIIKSYLDEFPFPYYVIVRDLNQLPLVLSEAMRQWFEMVNSE